MKWLLCGFRFSPPETKPRRGIGVLLSDSRRGDRFRFKPGRRRDALKTGLCDQVLPFLRKEPAGIVRAASRRDLNPGHKPVN